MISGFKLKMTEDDKLNENNMKSIFKKINISYSYDNSKKYEMINGFHVFIVERDCNDFFDVELIKKSKKINDDDLALILMREGTWYAPVYLVDNNENEKIGLYTMKHPVIKKLLEEI
jgi:hypothetical protein